MTTTKGALRNITTGILHTPIEDVYMFIEQYADAKGIMTHQLPSACRALIPILKTKLADEWFTDEWVKEGLEEPAEVEDLTDAEKKIFWQEYGVNAADMWTHIKDKTVVVKVD